MRQLANFSNRLTNIRKVERFSKILSYQIVTIKKWYTVWYTASNFTLFNLAIFLNPTFSKYHQQLILRKVYGFDLGSTFLPGKFFT